MNSHAPFPSEVGWDYATLCQCLKAWGKDMVFREENGRELEKVHRN